MPSNWMRGCHLILCRPLLLPPSVFPSIRVFSNESVLRIRWPKDWSFSFSISPSSEHSGLIFFRMNWLDLLAVQGTLKSLLQHHKSIISSVLSFLYGPNLTAIHDYWKNQRGTGHLMSVKVERNLLSPTQLTLIYGSCLIVFLSTNTYKTLCTLLPMIFPVVICGCDSWIIKKVEHRKTDAFAL